MYIYDGNFKIIKVYYETELLLNLMYKYLIKKQNKVQENVENLNIIITIKENKMVIKVPQF